MPQLPGGLLLGLNRHHRPPCHRQYKPSPIPAGVSIQYSGVHISLETKAEQKHFHS